MGSDQRGSQLAGWLALLLPALVVLILAGSCGLGAASTDINVNNNGPLPGLAVAISTMLSLGVGLVIAVVALIGAFVSRSEAGTRFLTVGLTVALAVPVGVIGGAGLGKSGVIQPAPTDSPPRSQPPNTSASSDMTLLIEEPGSLKVNGPARCESRGGSIRRVEGANGTAVWQVDGLDRVVVLRPNVQLAVADGVATEVDRVTIDVEEVGGAAVVYIHDSALPPGASQVEADGASGEVSFELRQIPRVPNADATPYPDWPATIAGVISWECVGP